MRVGKRLADHSPPSTVLFFIDKSEGIRSSMDNRIVDFRFLNFGFMPVDIYTGVRIIGAQSEVS